MARVLNNPFGELRGKTAAGVFTRTKAGEILRKYVKPVDTKTDKQVTVRSTFGGVSQSFCNLQPDVKSAWNGFAISGSKFNAKNTTNRGQYSGANAYVSLRMAALRAAAIGTEGYTVKLDSGVAASPTDFLDFTPSDNPPNYVLSPSIRSASANPDGSFKSIALTGVTSSFYDVSSQQLHVTLSYAGDSMVSVSKFADQWGEEFGLQFLASEAIKNSANRTKNPELFTIATIKCPTFTEALSPSTKGTLEFVIDVPPRDQGKYTLVAGNIYKVTAFCISRKGAFAKIGDTLLSVQA